MTKENSITPVSFKPGNFPSVEEMYADVRHTFIPWVMDRYGISQYYAEEILIESVLSFQNYVDQGHISDFPLEPHFLIYSFGAQVGDAYVQHIGKVGLGPMSFHTTKVLEADKLHGIQIVKVPFTYVPAPDRVTPLQKIADKAAEKLNPECQTLVRHLARTNLTPDQLAKVLGYGTEKGLTFMKDICLDKFSELLDEEIANR